jgi:hypothetical protein
MGEIVEAVNREPEGSLMQVLAISAPIVLVKVYPIPCEDPNHPVHPTFNVAWNWSDLGFIRPSRGFLRTYLRMIRKVRTQYRVAQIEPRRKRTIYDMYRTEPEEKDERSRPDEPPEMQRT